MKNLTIGFAAGFMDGFSRDGLVTFAQYSKELKELGKTMGFDILYFEKEMMSVEEAVEHPRIHFEGNLLNIESGADDDVLKRLQTQFVRYRLWPERNLFFGGAHTVMVDSKGGFHGMGDGRRGGICFSA